MINNDGKPSPQELQKRMDDIPDVWLKCPICGHAIYKKHINEYRTCPECHYGFRLGAKARIEMLCDDFKPLNLEVKAADKFDDPKYLEKLNKARQVTGLNEGVLSGIGSINGHKAAIGVMDWRFIMGSLGTATGEIIARLFEKATELNLPVILFTASGGPACKKELNHSCRWLKFLKQWPNIVKLVCYTSVIFVIQLLVE